MWYIVHSEKGEVKEISPSGFVFSEDKKDAIEFQSVAIAVGVLSMLNGSLEKFSIVYEDDKIKIEDVTSIEIIFEQLKNLKETYLLKSIECTIFENINDANKKVMLIEDEIESFKNYREDVKENYGKDN